MHLVAHMVSQCCMCMGTAGPACGWSIMVAFQWRGASGLMHENGNQRCLSLASLPMRHLQGIQSAMTIFACKVVIVTQINFPGH